MAIAEMAKVMIVSHRTDASELLEAIQREGICQVLNAEDAVVSKDFPELAGNVEKPKDIELLVIRLTRCLDFLKDYVEVSGGLAAALAPRFVIDRSGYDKIVGDEGVLEVLAESERIELELEKLVTERENIEVTLADLEPWKSLTSPVEELRELETTVCLAGLLPSQHYETAVEQVGELGAVIEHFGLTDNRYACLVFCIKEDISQVQKLLRSVDFEQTGFDHLSGTVAKLIEEYSEKLAQTKEQVKGHRESLKSLADNYLNLQILHDHYSNLLSREQTKNTSPATEQAVVFEAWVKKKDYAVLEKVVSGFSASSLNKIEPGEGEEIPVEIDNKDYIRPFESITRLYGMPLPSSIDPTVFLAPFFAIFFGLCLTDAAYGLVLSVTLWFFIKKIQGDTKMLWMFFVCALMSIVGGIITGSWFGDAIPLFLPQMDGFRKALMLFDPMEKPMVFFAISLALGYIQIMFGLFIAFFHHLKKKDIAAALIDKLTWLIMLNSLILFGLSKAGVIPGFLSGVFGITSIVPAVVILLFSVREGPWAGRIGMGVFNLFCTVFFVGDVLSYVRIMALGMVTGGFGMAVNIVTKLVSGAPYVGWLLGLLVFVGMHTFNLGMSVLGSFVHSMRLQFVEFFTKFFEGGGKQFQPLSKQYKYIHFTK